jgi:hypothetical protein
MANEKRLIYAGEIYELFYKQVEYGATDLMDAFEDALEDAQTADAVEVVHGRWIEDGYYGNPFVCSHCGREGCYSGDFMNKQYYYTNYCPNCGAKMDGGNEDGKDC